MKLLDKFTARRQELFLKKEIAKTKRNSPIGVIVVLWNKEDLLQVGKFLAAVRCGRYPNILIEAAFLYNANDDAELGHDKVREITDFVIAQLEKFGKTSYPIFRGLEKFPARDDFLRSFYFSNMSPSKADIYAREGLWTDNSPAPQTC